MRLSEAVAPSFFEVHKKIRSGEYTHYWLKGGRGSTKSSFASLEIILGMMKDPDANAVVIRKVAANLKDSVYEQLLWAVDKLGVSGQWSARLSPLELVYVRKAGAAKQRILFRGADKPKKLKSTKTAVGYIRYIWYEECDEFAGAAEIRTINQSLMRGGAKFDVFYTYNPPQSRRSWVNEEAERDAPGKLVHSSTYLDVPPEWLGEQFILEAEHLKAVKPTEYAHEYLGEVTGTGGEVFANAAAKPISDEEIKAFDNIKLGIDFGYAADPFVYVVCHFDQKHKRLYIFDEIYKRGLSNERAAQMIKDKGHYRQAIVADNAEPKSIAEMRRYGLNIRGAAKGRDSVEFGIKWLQSLERIIIDPVRCPAAADEFLHYELEPDGNDGFRDGYPDKNNHAIDAVRYALESESIQRKARVLKRDVLF